jgi:NitT/TauT family transport system permease protein
MSDAYQAASGRPELINENPPTGYGVIEKPLGRWERLFDKAVVRKGLLLIGLAIVWEIYGRWLDNSLLFPTFLQTVVSFAQGIWAGDLLLAAGHSIQTLLEGYFAGLLLAGIATGLAISTRLGADLLDMLTSMFNPLPSVAMLPLAMIWFGLGKGAIIFVLIHAVLWSVALNTHAGFRSVSMTWRMVGQNYGLSELAYVTRILIPGALPSIFTGLKTGWAFAWRTLIAAELVFGVSSGNGGLGWYIFQQKNMLEIPNVFAGLLLVIVFGLAVDNFVFRVLEQRTLRRWGMQQ